MKTNLVILVSLLIVGGATARVIVPFISWDRLIGGSTDIIVARGGKPTPLELTPALNGPDFDSTIQILSVLKGTNNAASARLWTDHQLWQGESYLIFGYYDSGKYEAFERYRVIPLGVDFSTNLIVGKSLDEQLQIMFKRRLSNLNRELEQGQEEKKRLEAGLKN